MGDTEKTGSGISLGDAKVTYLNFTANLAIFEEILEVLLLILDTLRVESKPLGLKVSWSKIQKLNALFNGNENL